jgi:integrase
MEARTSRRREKIETGIYRRGGSCSVRLRVRGRVVERHARTLAAARALRAELRSDPPAAAVNSRVTLNTYAETWLDSYQGRTGHGVRPETIDGYRTALDHHVLPVLGETRLGEITPQDVKALMTKLSRPPKPMKPASVRRTLAPLRALLADAFEEGTIRVNPFSGVRMPADPARPAEEKVKALTDTEAAELIAAVPEGVDRLLMRVMVATGLRTGEVLALRWGDIDPRRVNVRRAVSRSGRIGPPKSRAGQRAVPLPATLGRDLLELRTELGGQEADFAFPNARGGARDPKNFANRLFAPAARAAGVPWATPHDLRHTFASRAVREGVNVKQLQALLGHATIGVTLDTYAHLFDDDLPAALPEVEMARKPVAA